MGLAKGETVSVNQIRQRLFVAALFVTEANAEGLGFFVAVLFSQENPWVRLQVGEAYFIN